MLALFLVYRCIASSVHVLAQKVTPQGPVSGLAFGVSPAFFLFCRTRSHTRARTGSRIARCSRSRRRSHGRSTRTPSRTRARTRGRSRSCDDDPASGLS